jgi:cell division initiation protein
MPRNKAKESEQDLPAVNESRRITPVEIQQKEFRPAFRGYKERDVDVFLDQVTEEMARLHAENKRLREDLELRGVVGTGDDADAIVRRATDDAERILAEARARAAALAAQAGSVGRSGSEQQAGLSRDEAGSARTLIGAFLARERQFLQSLAGLIQEHAVNVKDEASRARDQIAAAVAVPGEGSAPASPTPASPPSAATSVPPAAGASRSGPASTPSGQPAGPEAEAGAGPPAAGSTGSATTGPPTTAHQPAPAQPAQPAGASGLRAESPGPAGGDAADATASWSPFDRDAADESLRVDPETRQQALAAQGREHTDEPEDRSIQELFWGEG